MQTHITTKNMDSETAGKLQETTGVDFVALRDKYAAMTPCAGQPPVM